MAFEFFEFAVLLLLALIFYSVMGVYRLLEKIAKNTETETDSERIRRLRCDFEERMSAEKESTGEPFTTPHAGQSFEDTFGDMFNGATSKSDEASSKEGKEGT